MTKIALIVLVVLIVLSLIPMVSGEAQLWRDYRTADRSSTGLAPPPTTTSEAIVQVYAARALNWRGIFGVHCWIATKPQDALEYHVHHVIGWRRYRNLPVVVSAPGVPDGRWFGNEPIIVGELRGEEAQEAIPKILEAVKSYPYPDEYNLWPGPNSNTFVAYVGKQVPELRMDLPTTAIGKDYPINGSIVDRAPSGTGFHMSMLGVLGFTLAVQEGVELNLLGLNFGVDFFKPAIKLPFVGRLGVGMN